MLKLVRRFWSDAVEPDAVQDVTVQPVVAPTRERTRAVVEGAAASPPRPPSHVDPSWLAWATLTAGDGGQVKTAGAGYHANELRAVLALTGRLVMAELRIEQEGQYAGAVRVHVAGTELGSIPHGLADKYRDVVGRLNEAGRQATCRAELDTDAGEYVDVWLSAKPKERSASEPFLPPVMGARVQLAEGEEERLQEALGARAKAKRVVRTGELVERPGGLALVVGDRELGRLPPGRYFRVEQAQTAGFPLTCRVRIIRAPDRPLRVEADFPTR